MSMKYCSSENYFRVDEINTMMFTGMIALQVTFCYPHKYRLTAYLYKNFDNPVDGCPNCVSVCLGRTRVLSKVPSKHFSNVRNFVLSNPCLARWIGVENEK